MLGTIGQRLDARTASAFDRVRALAYYFNNADQRPMERTAANLASSNAAFWHSASGGDAITGGFQWYLGEHADVLRACAAYEADFNRPCRMREPEFLDRLLPLNEAAVKSLLAAYSEAETFRTPDELRRRTDRAEGFDLTKSRDRQPVPARVLEVSL